MFPVIAVDFGGTHIRTALFLSDSPKPDRREKIDTLADRGPEVVLTRIIKAIQSVCPEARDKARIGIASPGPLDPFEGIILNAINLPGWINIPLKTHIASHFQVPVVIGNDAQLAALGEWKHGAGQGVKDMLYLTISTGIGGGIIADGKLLHGSRGLASELGHMTVVPDGPLCGCGQPGHLEAIASGTALARIARERLQAGHTSLLQEWVGDDSELTAEIVGHAALEGDELARSVILEAGRAVGSILANLVHAFNPARIVIGGGVSQLGDLLFRPIRMTLERASMHPAYLENLNVVPAMLGDDAGLVGAMVLARQ